ncbi:MAG TPA: TssN family type VI secretion system protein [Mucilaginibacter sp.]|nr:TssN family type VI secretion system protein [Mucilaginibacter sp.]
MTAFFAFAKSLSKGLSSLTKKDILILVCASLLNVFLLFAITYLVDSLFTLFWIFCFLYLVFGVVNFMLMHNRFLPSPGEKKYPGVFAEIFFSLAVMLFVTIITSLLIYFVKDALFILYPVMLSVLAFIIPQFFYYTFDAAYNIPVTDFNVWEYPVSKRIDPPDESLNENLLVIGFNISKKVSEQKTVFRAKAPENIILGELFYHFINEYNEEKSETPIEFLDDYKDPIIWWFRLQRKWYQFNKVLDPSLRIRDNFIKENSVIICEQLIKTPIKQKENER